MNPLFDRHHDRSGNSVKLLRSGHGYFSALESLITGARHFIHIQVYIFDKDSTGTRILELLKDAAARGVHVYIVADGYASDDFSSRDIVALGKAGVVFKKFSPVHPSFRFTIGRRMHHKIAIADGQIALVGGINIASKYEGTADELPWLDFAVEVRGPLCRDLVNVCERLWRKKVARQFRRLTSGLPLPPSQPENMTARLLQNDWTHRNIEISRAYRYHVRHAKHSVTIVASYFLPGMRMRSLLRKAAARGVKVRLLLSGKSDVRLSQLSSNYLYPFLLRQGIEVYEWQNSVLHGKMMICDGSWTTVGSYNLNALSDYGSLELNVAVSDAAFAQRAEAYVNDLISEGCTGIVPKDYELNRNVLSTFAQWTGYQLTRMLFKTYFFLLRNDKPHS